MTDRLIKLYELNEQYHDTKEKRAWLATTFYAAFCSAVIKWATNKENEDFLQTHNILPIIIFSGVIFLCVVSFNWFQYRKKRASVKIANFIEIGLKVQNGSDNDQLERVFDYRKKVHKPWWKRTKKKNKRSCYLSTEIQIFVLMVAFLFAQVSVILIASGKWPLVVKCFTG